MSTITGLTRGGTQWTPAFITALNQANCIGCESCSRVCPKSCLSHEPQAMAA
jgi:formate hydrogenlyase subunit 6/NADH:ubiquinone oxidoreductase subunit I